MGIRKGNAKKNMQALRAMRRGYNARITFYFEDGSMKSSNVNPDVFEGTRDELLTVSTVLQKFNDISSDWGATHFEITV